MDSETHHHIRRHILKVLTYNKLARYRDIRPAGIDSNVFNYHRKALVTAGYIVQNDDKTYQLSPKGLRYVEMSSVSTLKPRAMPKLTVGLVLRNQSGHVAFWQKPVQPFIGTWMLPNGKVRFASDSLDQEALRVLQRVTSEPVETVHRGVMEWTVCDGGELITHTITHIFTAELAQPVELGNIVWIKPDEAKNLAPGVQEIIKFVRTRRRFDYINHTIHIN